MNATTSGKSKSTLNLIVRYAAAEPFKDKTADSGETLGSAKQRALEEFELSDEGTAANGNVIVYKLFHGREEQTDLTKTLGQLAGPAGALELKLSQHVQQGRLVVS